MKLLDALSILTLSASSAAPVHGKLNAAANNNDAAPDPSAGRRHLLRARDAADKSVRGLFNLFDGPSPSVGTSDAETLPNLAYGSGKPLGNCEGACARDSDCKARQNFLL